MARALVLSGHVRREAERRSIPEAVVRAVAEEPEQTVQVRPGREVRQSRVAFPADGRTYLVRVVVETQDDGEVVVTAYRTSKIDKYWRPL